MSFENQTISVHYARALVAAARRRGFDPAPLLQAASLNQTLLERPEMRITPEQLARLMQAAWQMEDDEFLGMAATSCRHGIFTLMAKQAIHCGNLRGVYRHLCRFYNLITDAIRLELEVEGDQARLSMQLAAPEQDTEHMLVDFLLLLWHRFPAWLIGKRIPLARVQFSFPRPAHAKEYQLLFPCRLAFDEAENGFSFPAEMLSLPVVQTATSLRAHLTRAPLDWFKKQHYYPTYTRRVLDALLPDTEFVNLQIEAVAEKLAMTSRTLRRKLTEEGNSFQEIKNIARRDTAIHLLSQRHIPVSVIAQRLGYTETASFSRAFREWTGVTPLRYKA